MSREHQSNGIHKPKSPGQHADASHAPAAHSTQEAASQAAQAALSLQALSPADLLALQRTIGNAAVNRLLRQQAPQPWPNGGRLSPPIPAWHPLPAGAPTEVQTDPSPDLQRHEAADAPAPADGLGQRIRARAGQGRPLGTEVQSRLEAGLSADLSGVRVHTDGEADSLSQAVQAVAFTTGSDIFFRSGTYNPSTPQGLHLLAHEAAHTVQQAAGPVAGTPHPGGVSISDPSDSFERAAESVAARVASVPDAPVQRHADDDDAHVCTAACRHTHTVQRTSQTHECGPHCHHAARSRSMVMRRAAHAPVKQSAAVQRATGVLVAVQRHSSFEHKMLGDVSPDDLKVLASAKNLNKAGAAVTTPFGGAPVAILGPNGAAIMKKDVVHVLEQEIRRLNYFKSKAVHPTGEAMSRQEYQTRLRDLDRRDRINERADEIAKDRTLRASDKLGRTLQAIQDVQDSQWQVRIVSLRSRDGSDPLLVTYGEMNTLADLYGSPQEVLDADPKNRYQLVQGIRQQSIIKFLDMLREVNGANYLTRTFGMHLGEGFDDAIGNTGRGGSTLGELSLMGTGFATGKKTGMADASQNYKAGLARNACHFAPESWHAWADYHMKARQHARTARMHRRFGRDQAARDQADEEENLALINNGFGDHFLQDSYAAGHLINKTQVMQWFVKWLDTHPWQSDKKSASIWREMQAMGYNQPGLGLEANRYDTAQVGNIRAKDAQSVENMPDPADPAGPGGPMQGQRDRFAALGLRLPPSLTPNDPAFNFLVAWQENAATNSGTRKMTVQQAVAAHPQLALNHQDAVTAFKLLVTDDVARVSGVGITRQDLRAKSNAEITAMTFVLRPEYIPADAAAFATLRADFGSGVAATRTGAQQQYADKALTATYAQYHKFLNNTLLQAGTNGLHDHFCKEGIEVLTATNVPLGRIYGDDAMLGKDSATGVKYSGETAQMSRKAIFDIIDYGPADPAHPIPAVTAIAGRFPTQARLDDGSYGRLDRWHQDLEQLCYNKIFPDIKGKVTGNSRNVAATFSSDLSNKVSKDVHQGALF